MEKSLGIISKRIVDWWMSRLFLRHLLYVWLFPLGGAAANLLPPWWFSWPRWQKILKSVPWHYIVVAWYKYTKMNAITKSRALFAYGPRLDCLLLITFSAISSSYLDFPFRGHHSDWSFLKCAVIYISVWIFLLCFHVKCSFSWPRFLALRVSPSIILW